MVYIKTYILNHFYWQYLVLLTMVPRITYLAHLGQQLQQFAGAVDSLYLEDASCPRVT